MRITWKLVSYLAIVIAVVAVSFSFWQAGQEEFRMRNELEKRSSLLADGLQESVISLLEKNDSQALTRLVNKFSNREKIMGISIYDMDGTLLVASSGLDLKEKRIIKITEKILLGVSLP